MSSADTLSAILDVCIDIDQTANDIYNSLSEFAGNEALKNFWKRMAGEGDTHLEYLTKLKALAGEEVLPEAFENPDTVLRELESRAGQIRDLLQQWENERSLHNAFVTAYRLEAYKLHPAIRTLSRYYRPMTDGASLVEKDKDESNISAFVEALHKYGEVTPELELIGETLQRLWEQNKQLSRLAMADDLTGLLNRRGFLFMARQLAHLSRRNRIPLTILIIEVDNFKQVNETHGAQVGDDILMAVADKIQSMLRGSDLLARLGGDEFIAMLPNTALDGGLSVAEKIRQAIETMRPAKVPITVSLGVSGAVLQEDVAQELDSLINYAEGNLIIAKTSGKNRVVS